MLSDESADRLRLLLFIILIAAALLSLVMALAPPAFAAPAASKFVCANNPSFSVAISERAATVHTGSVALQLPRKQSSIGQKFAAPGVTLIIDGHFAALIGTKLPRFDQCYTDRKLVASR